MFCLASDYELRGKKNWKLIPIGIRMPFVKLGFHFALNAHTASRRDITRVKLFTEFSSSYFCELIKNGIENGANGRNVVDFTKWILLKVLVKTLKELSLWNFQYSTAP